MTCAKLNRSSSMNTEKKSKLIIGSKKAIIMGIMLRMIMVTRIIIKRIKLLYYQNGTKKSGKQIG